MNNQYSDKTNLEVMIFDAIEYLENQLKIGQRNPTLKMRYQTGLAALDILNEKYRKLTGAYLIPQEKVLKYHSQSWDVYS